MTRKATQVISGGVVHGTWSRKGDELTITWQSGRRPPEEAIEREATRLAGILGTDLQVRPALQAAIERYGPAERRTFSTVRLTPSPRLAPS